MFPTSNHNCCRNRLVALLVVYLLFPTSNHNCRTGQETPLGVVYLLFPTSNHNDCSLVFSACLLYIFCFLHQTTTLRGVESEEAGCISFVSYIKPQPDGKRMHSPHRCISFVSYIKPQPCNLVPISATGCISFVSYIKPQLRCRSLGSHRVVYLLFPTSNHNPRSCAWRCFRLYIFCFLHQTTTPYNAHSHAALLYIFCFLHQTTTLHL